MARKKISTNKKKKARLDALPVEMVPIDELKEHPRNYRQHPQDQIDHLKSSIEQHGFFKNLVIAKDNTILAGHGAKKAAKQLGFTEVPCVRLPLKPDDPRALKVLAADNEIEHLAEQDDRLLSDILKGISEIDSLLGTGYDEMMLANLVFVTRPESEIGSKHGAEQWVGLPEFEGVSDPYKVIIRFETLEDKLKFGKKSGIKITENTISIWWPERQMLDSKSVKFEQSNE